MYNHQFSCPQVATFKFQCLRGPSRIYGCINVCESLILTSITYINTRDHLVSAETEIKFSSLAALEVVILLTFNAVRGEDLVKMISSEVSLWSVDSFYENTLYHLANRGADSHPLRKCLHLLTSAKLSSQDVSVIYYSSSKQSSYIQHIL